MDREEILTRRARERIGTVLREKWTLERLLGVGGMAAVYAVRHRNGKLGAVKLLHLDISRDREWRQRFLREGYVANRIGHPGVVSVLDDDTTDDGSVFLVMELLDGEPANARAAARPEQRLEASEVARIAVEVLDVLAAAHDQGIVHRDIKPENLFLTREGPVKVLDFGIARMREHPADGAVTRTGATMGTPAYMPPEQALGDTGCIDERTDIWALGATMFNLLTGRYVHEADTANKLLLAAMTRPAPPVRSFRPDLPHELAAIVDRALAFDQKDRFQSAREMQQALWNTGDPALLAGPRASVPTFGSFPPPTLPPLPPRPGAAAQTGSAVARDSLEGRPRRRSGPIIAALCGALFVLAVIVGVDLRRRGAPEPSPASPSPSPLPLPLPLPLPDVGAAAAPSPLPPPAPPAPAPTASAADAPSAPDEELIFQPEPTAPGAGWRPSGGSAPKKPSDPLNTW